MLSHHTAVNMSHNRLDARDVSPKTSMTMAAPTGIPTRCSTIKLPPLSRDNLSPNSPPMVTGRSMHQIQLEMEYDAEESDNDSAKGPSIHGWPGGLERHANDHFDGLGDLAAREIHALCIFDDLAILSSARPWSYAIEALGKMPTMRKWGRWRWREQPAFSRLHVVEAIMVYERGVEQSTNDRRCSRCRAGQGISPQCVVAPEEIGTVLEIGCCSNCLYDGVQHVCNASGRKTPIPGGRERSAEAMGDPDKVVDHMAVLEMIAQLKRPSGTHRDQSLSARARRIETAALQIAQAARDWGDKVAREA